MATDEGKTLMKSDTEPNDESGVASCTIIKLALSAS